MKNDVQEMSIRVGNVEKTTYSTGTDHYKVFDCPLMHVAYWEHHKVDCRLRTLVQEAIEEKEKARVAYERAQEKLRDAERVHMENQERFTGKVMEAIGLHKPDSFHKAYCYPDGDCFRINVTTRAAEV